LSILRPFLTAQFLRFVMVGGVAATGHWLARIAIDRHVSYLAALVLAYPVGIALGYLLNVTFVFSSNPDRRLKEISTYALLTIAMFPIVIAVSWGISELVFTPLGMTYHPREIAHAIGVLSPVAISFLLHKFLTFKTGD